MSEGSRKFQPVFGIGVGATEFEPVTPSVSSWGAATLREVKTRTYNDDFSSAPVKPRSNLCRLLPSPGGWPWSSHAFAPPLPPGGQARKQLSGLPFQRGDLPFGLEWSIRRFGIGKIIG